MIVIIVIVVIILLILGGVILMMKKKPDTTPSIPKETSLKVFTSSVDDPRAVIYYYAKINSLNDNDSKLVQDLFGQPLDSNNNYAFSLEITDPNLNKDNLLLAKNFEDLKNLGLDLDCMLKVAKGESYTYQCKNFIIQGLVFNPKGNTDILRVMGKGYRENSKPLFEIPYNEYTKSLYDKFFNGINN